VVEELQPKFNGNIVTEVDLVKLYNVAEDYHQGYLEKGGRNGRAQSAAKGCNDPIRCYG
jgi:peptide-methionine (S)-S-oxide reductase